ncbi:MAG TPA: hypothetical protein VHF89_06595 [Solirubrobacteraceae bacterium]|nr:hypothetical protein [Solirubrobacteraceae bacterium]
MASLLVRVVLFLVLLPFLVIWLAAAAITWGADAILSSSRQRPAPPFAVARRTSDQRFRSTVAVFVVLVLAIGAAGGGGGESGSGPDREVVATPAAEREDAAREEAEAATRAAEAAEAAQAAEARAERAERRAERIERRIRAAERRRARLAAQRRRERRAREAALLAAQREEEAAAAAEPAENCHPSYTGACLDPDAADYDCEGGEGDGPLYTGTVTVVGDDEYDLERDDDGIACDAS